MFDLLIRNGQIIDGAKTPAFRADLGIRGDSIAAIGDLSAAAAAETIDVNGRVVAPGFIDVHNHSDGWMLRQPHLLAKTSQGFTTEILMADGISYAPVDSHTWRQWFYYLRSLNGLSLGDYRGWRTIGEFMQRLDGKNVQNAAAHVPYANVRAMSCGFTRGAVDDFQMRQIQADIRRGLSDGAVGLSTGLDYISQCFSTTEELVEACSAMHGTGGVYVTHVRYKKTLLPAIREAVEIGRRAGVPVHISHLKAHEQSQIDEVLQYIDTVARHEVDFSFDVYPYQPGSTMLSYLLPYEIWEDGPLAALEKLADPAVRGRIGRGFDVYRLPLEKVHIAWLGSRANSHLCGWTLQAVIDAEGRSAEDVLCDLLIEENMAVLLVINEGDDRMVQPMFQHELCMLGSDGIYFPDGQVHPRVYGSAPRVLGHFARDLRLFSLETAVHKLSGYAAGRFRLAKRGVLAAGNFADIVIFDPQRVAALATYDQPHQLSIGIEHVIVNGRSILRDGAAVNFPTGPLPGRFLRA